MKNETDLLEFLDTFFLKLKQFPPSPGIVTYDHVKVTYRHPEGLHLGGAIAHARNPAGANRIFLRLVLELSNQENVEETIRLDLKDSFDISRPDHLELARENLKRMANNVLISFSRIEKPDPADQMAAGG